MCIWGGMVVVEPGSSPLNAVDPTINHTKVQDLIVVFQ